MLPLALLLWAAGPDAAAKVTAKNFAHHPAIAEARATYEEVEKRLHAAQLDLRVRAAEEECYDWSELRLATDTSSTARYFFRLGGGQDSVHRHHFYYDSRGVLRFALLQGGATSDSTIETRVWFDSKGREIYRTDKRTGPGWTWIEGDPAMLIRDPLRMFREGVGDCRLGPPRR
ncbi:MAG: hypothetical protein U1E65_09645 [Myxococcota bacterium]